MVTATNAWYDEAPQYDYSQPRFSGSTGHFTQLVWKETTKVGCGVNAGCGMKTYVCQYSPQGALGSGGWGQVAAQSCVGGGGVRWVWGPSRGDGGAYHHLEAAGRTPLEDRGGRRLVSAPLPPPQHPPPAIPWRAQATWRASLLSKWLPPAIERAALLLRIDFISGFAHAVEYI